jgi:protein translocase SecG subunit
MLKFIWLIISLVLIILILTRTPKNSGLESFATKSNLLGSPNSAEKILNQFTWLLIAGYFILGVSFNVLN